MVHTSIVLSVFGVVACVLGILSALVFLFCLGEILFTNVSTKTTEKTLVLSGIVVVICFIAVSCI